MENDLLTLVEQDGFRAVRRSASRGGQLNGPCPFCGGTDRFRVQPHHGTYGWFACNQCQRKGNAVDYLMMKRGYSKGEALAAVGWTPKDGSTLHVAVPKYAQDERPQWNEPPALWQDAATAFYQECHRVLWGDAGQEVRAYLQGRGFTEQTIKAAMLGYHPHETYGLAREWGKPVKLPQGLVIPWFFERQVWRVTIRNPHVQEGAGRYTQIAGGSNGLYLADSLGLKRSTVVIVEGEFDALSLAQECGDQISVVATGTTQGSHTPRWISALSQAPRVLVAFDAEDKGDAAAAWWESRLENAERLRPWWKDANQMLQDGADLRQWVSESDAHPKVVQVPLQGELIPRNETSPCPDLEAEDKIPTLADVCQVCGAEVEHYSEEGTAFCAKHWSELAYCTTPSDTSMQEQSGNFVSSAADFVTPENTHAMTQEQFMAIAERIASVFPGGCQITPLPVGTTLAQWIAAHPRQYTPCLLPSLPRANCPAMNLVERQAQVPHTKQYYREPKLVPCKNKPQASGWCEEHQLAQTMLDLGARLGYPELELNPYLSLPDGKASWEEHVVRRSKVHLERDVKRVQTFMQQQVS